MEEQHPAQPVALPRVREGGEDPGRGGPPLVPRQRLQEGLPPAPRGEDPEEERADERQSHPPQERRGAGGGRHGGGGAAGQGERLALAHLLPRDRVRRGPGPHHVARAAEVRGGDPGGHQAAHSRHRERGPRALLLHPGPVRPGDVSRVGEVPYFAIHS